MNYVNCNWKKVHINMEEWLALWCVCDTNYMSIKMFVAFYVAKFGWLLNDYFIWHWVLFFQNSISFYFSGEVQGGWFSSSTSICWDLPKLPDQNRAVHQLSEVWWWGDELGRCTWQRSINRRKKCTKLGTQAGKGILASYV